MLTPSFTSDPGLVCNEFVNVRNRVSAQQSTCLRRPGKEVHAASRMSHLDIVRCGEPAYKAYRADDPDRTAAAADPAACARYTFAPGAHPQRQVLRRPAVPSPGVYGLDSPRGILDLQHQRHPGRLRRPPGGSRRRRDTRLLHPPHGRGRGDAVGPRHLRDDGELLAGGRPRRRGGAAGDARVGGQAGGQAEVRGVVDAKGLPVDRSARRIP